MKTEICFIRHGETSWNQEGRIQGTIDNPLNVDGINEAKMLATYLKEYNPNWDALIASPLSRAQETANYLQEKITITKRFEEPRFIERQFGDAEGVVITKELYRNIMEENVKGLEPGIQIQERVYQATLDIAKCHLGKRVLVVAHSHVIKALLIRIDPSYSFETSIKNLSLTTLVYAKDTLTIKKVNQVVI